MSEASDNAADNVTELPLSASEVLRSAREALGITQDQVAAELYLTPNYIRLIDSDEIDKIAKQAFVRGYLRSYAKMVHVDADDVVARYEASQTGQPQKIKIRGVTQEPVGSTSFTGPVFQTGILGLVGLVVVIALVWFFAADEEEAPVVVRTAEPEVVLDQLEPATEAVSDSAITGDSLPAATDTESAAVLGADTNTDTATEVQGAETPVVNPQIMDDGLLLPVDAAASSDDTATDSNSEAPATVLPETSASSAELTEAARQISLVRNQGVIQVDAGGNDELRFFFTDECWVEIEDGQGDSIYGDLNRDGDELVVKGTAPFEVLFGKAPAVTMEYNGSPIDLAPHTTSVDTAKVTVGN